MSKFLDIARLALMNADEPKTSSEMWNEIITKGYDISFSKGLTPEATFRSYLYVETKKKKCDIIRGGEKNGIATFWLRYKPLPKGYKSMEVWKLQNDINELGQNLVEDLDLLSKCSIINFQAELTKLKSKYLEQLGGLTQGDIL